MPDRMTLVARALNGVESAGQARAAIAAAEAELDYGRSGQVAGALNPWNSPNAGEAYDTLSLLTTALDAELRGFASQADDSPVDQQAWARTRREIERAYIEVSGIEGEVQSQARTDDQVGQILLEAVANAPRVFGEAVGTAVSAVGETAGKAGAGLLSGLGLVGMLVLAIVVVVVLKARVV